MFSSVILSSDGLRLLWSLFKSQDPKVRHDKESKRMIKMQWNASPCKALAKGTRQSTQVNTSLQNQNLRTDLRRVAKRIRKSACKSQKAVNFTHIIS